MPYTNKTMATLSLIKYLYSFITYYCYIGTSIIAFDQIFADNAIKNIVSVNPAAQHIILALLIVFWLLKIFWFMYEKFVLETRERKLKMESDKDDLDDRRSKRVK